MKPVLMTLRRMVAPGPGGLRNEYLRCLVGEFAPGAAEETVKLLGVFGSAMANDELPWWFVCAFCSAELVAPIKRKPEPGATPDVRPITVQDTLRKCVGKAVLQRLAGDYDAYLAPQQLGVGVSCADSKLIHGLRLLLELNPGFILVSIDIVNAYNAASRAAILHRHMEVPDLRAAVPYLRAELSAATSVYAGGKAILSDEGVQQGSPIASAAFAVAIHPEVKAADEALAAHGGCARFGMDDGYLLGPPDVVFHVLGVLERDLLSNVGLVLNVRKCQLLCGPGVDAETVQQDAPPGLKRGSIALPDGGLAYGVTIFNVPVGDPQFVQEFLRRKADKIVEAVDIHSRRLAHYSHELWTMLHYSLQHRATYWLRNMPPDDLQSFCCTVDEAVLKCASAATLCSFPAASYAHRRLFLPARLRGGGLRLALHTCSAAYVGALHDVLPTFIDRHDEEDRLIPGLYSSQLRDHGLFSDCAYDAVGGDRQVQLLEKGAELTCVRALVSAWAAMHDEAVGTLSAYPEDPDDFTRLLGPLAVDSPARTAGRLLVAGDSAISQRSLTQALERVRHQGMLEYVNSLPPSQGRIKKMHRQLDAYSSTWIWAVPTGNIACSPREFHEVAATYFLLPSPALRGLEGKHIWRPGVGRGRAGRHEMNDGYGDTLTAAQLPGDAHSLQHDASKDRIVALAQECGVRAAAEVQDIFHPLLPSHAPARQQSAQNDNTSVPGAEAEVDRAARLRSIVPDILFRLPAGVPLPPPFEGGGDVLLEVKTVHPGTPYDPQHRRAVEHRTLGLKDEIEKKLRAKDCEWFGVPVHSPEAGPLLSHFRSKGFVGLAFGHVGEVSSGVQQVVKLLAQLGAGAHGARTGALSRPDAVAALKKYLQVQVAMTAWKARAQLLLQRVSFVGRSAATPRRRFTSRASGFQGIRDCHFRENPATAPYRLHVGT